MGFVCLAPGEAVDAPLLDHLHRTLATGAKRQLRDGPGRRYLFETIVVR